MEARDVSLIDRIMAEPELRAAPPVLVDVGAAGGVPRAWRRISRHAIGVGFEPDRRETAPLQGAGRQFARWVLCRSVVVPAPPPDGTALLNLTQSPQCSSGLEPNAAALREWMFADFFRVVERRAFPATTLLQALADEGIERIDWLKCDTQGLDLKLYLSLPVAWRARLLAVEFEPGLMAAYVGEDRLADVLAAMATEPFWLSELKVGHATRGRVSAVSRKLGPGAVPWVRRLGPMAPGWANARFLRDLAQAPEVLDRRAHLLAWVFATISGQHGQALTIAGAAAERFGGGIFLVMETASVRELRWAMLVRAPALLWRRLTRPGA